MAHDFNQYKPPSEDEALKEYYEKIAKTVKETVPPGARIGMSALYGLMALCRSESRFQDKPLAEGIQQVIEMVEVAVSRRLLLHLTTTILDLLNQPFVTEQGREAIAGVLYFLSLHLKDIDPVHKENIKHVLSFFEQEQTERTMERNQARSYSASEDAKWSLS